MVMATPATIGASLTISGCLCRCSALAIRSQPCGAARAASTPTKTETALARPASAAVELVSRFGCRGLTREMGSIFIESSYSGGYPGDRLHQNCRHGRLRNQLL